MNKLKIEVPEGYEIDWKESKKQETIVFKKKQLTYEDVCEKLFEKSIAYYTDGVGVIHTFDPKYPILLKSPNNATSEHQLKCLLAKNKLANIARYLNGDWEWDRNGYTIINKYHPENKASCLNVIEYKCFSQKANVFFKTQALAEQAIDILGEETIKLALTPLY